MDTDITLDELREKKKELCERLTALIEEFESETTVSVKTVELKKSTIKEMTVEVEL